MRILAKDICSHTKVYAKIRCKGYAGQCDSKLKDNNDELVARGKVSKCRDYHNYYQVTTWPVVLISYLILA